jgi:hypothetical protein
LFAHDRGPSRTKRCVRARGAATGRSANHCVVTPPPVRYRGARPDSRAPAKARRSSGPPLGSRACSAPDALAFGIRSSMVPGRAIPPGPSEDGSSEARSTSISSVVRLAPNRTGRWMVRASEQGGGIPQRPVRRGRVVGAKPPRKRKGTGGPVRKNTGVWAPGHTSPAAARSRPSSGASPSRS